MATNIRLKSSSLAGKTPTLSDLSLRELAVNTADGKLFLRKGDGSGTDKIIDVTGPLQASEPMGHEDKSQSIISFNSTTRVFTIQPVSTSFNVWCKGVKYNFTTAQTVTLPNTTGIYYIYFDGNGVLQQRTSYFDWENDAPTAYVYWNATTGTAPFVADERHGIVLDWQTHEYLHRTRGAVIANGFSISNYTTTGTGANNTDAQFDLGGGTFFDEDLEVVITHSNTPTSDTWQQDLQGPSQIPVFYQSGNAWVRDTPTDYALKQGTARIQYNYFNGASWSALDVSTDTWYTTSWIIATNNINYPVIAIMGQSAANKISDEESIGFGDLVLDGFPVVEFRPLWKIIWQTDSGYANTPNARIAGVYDIRQLSAGGGFTGATPVSDHGLLTGLGDDDHLQYLHVTQTRTGVTAQFNTTGQITTTSNIGVGTATPTAKLDVLGGDIVLTTASDPRVYIQTTGIGGGGFDIKKSDDSWSWRFTAEPDGFKVRDHLNSLDKFYIEDGASGNVWFDNIANVGIGTTNPTSNLHTVGTGLFENDGGFSGPTGDDYPKVPLIAKLSNTLGNTFFGAINPYNYPAFAINVYGYSNSSTNRGRVEFFDKTDGNWNKSIVLNTGYVGIGTDTPGSKLAVNGYITESTDGGVTYHNVVTQQDIGFNANQIPLNQYLGQLAFMDTYSPSGLRRDGGGSDDVIVNSSGNVGIGTTNPRQKIEINSDTYDGLRINTNSQYPTIWLAQSGADKWSISSNLNNDNAFVIRESTVADRLTILTGGNVGIGTTNPTSTLHVQGSARITGSIASTNYFITTSTGSVTGGAAIPISNISATSYRSVEYIIQAVSTNNHQVTKLLLVHNGTNAYITEYGSMTTNAQVASYTADISINNSIVVTATPASANATNFKVYATAIAV